MGGHTTSRKPTRAPSRRPETGGPSATSVARLAIVFVTGLLVFTVLAGWVAPLAPVVVGVLVGAWIGLVVKRPVVAAALGAAVGLLGSVAAAWLYAIETVQELYLAMPAWGSPDIPVDYWSQFVAPMQDAMVWNARPALGVILALVVTPLAAYGVSLLSDRVRDGHRAREIVGWACAALLVVVFAVTGATSGDIFKRAVSFEPIDGTYQYDALIYVKTFYLMEDGLDFYPAAVEAASRDARLAKEGAVVDGKFVKFWYEPSYFRQPLAFQTWSTLADSGDGVVGLSVGVCAAALLALYAGFRKLLGPDALVVAMMMFPWLLSHTLWLNVFFPEWWAAIATVLAIAALAARLDVPAVALAVVGSLFRFSALPLLATIAVAAAMLAFRKADRARMLRTLGAAVAGVVLFAFAWQHHIARATAYIDPSVMSKTTTASVFAQVAGIDFGTQALAPVQYSMWPYGFATFPLIVLFPFAIAGFALVMKRPLLGLAGSLFGLGWLAFLLVSGPPSSYWGQVFTGAFVIGVTLFLVRLPKAGRAWRDLTALVRRGTSSDADATVPA